MDKLIGVDWGKMLSLDTPVLEIVLRGTVVYLGLYALLRFVLKRESGGEVGIADLLVLVLIADAAQNAMAGEYTSLPEGLILVAVIIFWSYALDRLHYHAPWLRWILRPPGIVLVPRSIGQGNALDGAEQTTHGVYWCGNMIREEYRAGANRAEPTGERAS